MYGWPLAAGCWLQITLQMQDDVDGQNRMLDNMGNTFDSVGSQLKRTMTKLQLVIAQPHNRQTLMIAGTISFLFLLFLLFGRSKKTA
ncbi:hypothetical protein BC831DRAFT_452696 [Entophlyctis helioformis]|nr:hypothetical protein BC831DRAFT_452696 [Entophlyctis helioformis]